MLSAAARRCPARPLRRAARTATTWPSWRPAPALVAAAHLHPKRVWVPELEPGDDPRRSKFGGRPFIPPSAPGKPEVHWPRCDRTDTPLLFLCQFEAQQSPVR